MSSINLAKTFVTVFDEMLSYLDIDHKFMCEVPESSLNSGEPVNVLVGVTGDMEGNIMFGYAPETAKDIVAKLIGVKSIGKLDSFAEAALADFCADFCRRFIQMIKIEYNVVLSYPSYASGDDMYAMISKVPSKKIFFKINEKKFNMAYNLEKTHGG